MEEEEEACSVPSSGAAAAVDEDDDGRAAEAEEDEWPSDDEDGKEEVEEESVERAALLLCHCPAELLSIIPLSADCGGCGATAGWLLCILTVAMFGEPSMALMGLYSNTANCRCTVTVPAVREELDDESALGSTATAVDGPAAVWEGLRRADGSIAKVMSLALESPAGQYNQPLPPP